MLMRVIFKYESEMFDKKLNLQFGKKLKNKYQKCRLLKASFKGGNHPLIS